MKIAVTGGTGTLGSYVLRELVAAGHEVTNVSRGEAPAWEGVRFVRGDIMEPETLAPTFANQEAVIHMAAVPGPRRQPPPRLIEINVVGTVNALEAALAANVERFVLASSGAALGFAFQTHDLIPEYLPLDEDHPCRPEDDYGLSKLLAELACERYARRYGLKTRCLRVHNNWYLDRPGAEVACGSGWARNLRVEDLWAIRYAKTINDPDGDWPVPGPPAPHRILWAFTDARDAAQGFRLAAENGELGHEVFLIGGNDTCSREETADLIARYYPGVPLRAPLRGHSTLWSHAKAAHLLGYRPSHSWRESDFSEWLAGRPSPPGAF